ncbi:MAG: Holliday junction branch migration protein RuvA [Bacteroidia bacterium]|nr:Holliday junction branch migration protein RuvA [Bacteroidia bacterium]
MYDYIKGRLTEVTPTYAVIENSGIGYIVNISLNTFSKLKPETESKLYLHQVIREDAHLFFGFSDKKEREIFRLLISVNGIGANTARMMLSSLSGDEIQMAILNSDVNLLKSIKGIGIKTAQRVVIELKDKLDKGSFGEEILLPQNNTLRNESFSALIMLGFPKAAVEKSISKVLTEEPDISVEELVKKALKFL